MWCHQQFNPLAINMHKKYQLSVSLFTGLSALFSMMSSIIAEQTWGRL